MICKKCGTRFSDGMFCPECGASMALVVDLDEKGIEHLEEDCDTSKYGTYGELEEQCINKEIKINAGGKKVFENKKLIFKSDIGIKMEDNANLEFINCSVNIDDKATAIWASRGENIKFEHCDIKGNGDLICRWCGGNGSEDNDYSMLEFWDCELSDSGGLIDNIFGSAYFENCIIRERSITRLKGKGAEMSFGGLVSKLEFRNCIIIKTNIHVEGEVKVNLDNCSIKNVFGNLVYHGGRYSLSKERTSIKNCYFDDCYPNDPEKRRYGSFPFIR